MKKQVFYSFEKEDPNWPKRLGDWLNTLVNFRPTPSQYELKANNTVLLGNQFTKGQVEAVCCYGERIADIAIREYTEGHNKDSPIRDSVLQNAARLKSELQEFWVWFTARQ